MNRPSDSLGMVKTVASMQLSRMALISNFRMCVECAEKRNITEDQKINISSSPGMHIKFYCMALTQFRCSRTFFINNLNALQKIIWVSKVGVLGHLAIIKTRQGD